jgi:hypothetical protein
MLQPLLSSSKNLEIPTMSLVLEIARPYLDAFAGVLSYRLVFFTQGGFHTLLRRNKYDYAAVG